MSFSDSITSRVARAATLGRLEFRRDEDAAAREAVGDALAQGDDARADAVPLVSEELAGAAVAALDLVKDEAGTPFAAEGFKLLHKGFGRQVDAAAALDALDDYARYIASLEHLLHASGVIEFAEAHFVVGVERRDD